MTEKTVRPDYKGRPRLQKVNSTYDARQRKSYQKNRVKILKNRKTEYRKSKKIRKYHTDYHKIQREKLFDIVGHVCVDCGFSDKRALQFDHVHGNGHVDRRRFGDVRKMLRFYINNPKLAKKELKTRCANCNVIKRIINNESRKLKGVKN